MNSGEQDFVFKILLIGNQHVGKSSLLMRFAEDFYQQTFLPTIGVDFKIRMVRRPGSTMKLQLWDTAGQERFRAITATLYRQAHGIIMIFDLTDRVSFQDVRQWLKEVDRMSNQNPVIVLVGNKCDLWESRSINKKEIEQYARKEGLIYYQTSAKSGTNVQLVFQNLSDSIKQKFAEQYIQRYRRTSTYTTAIRPKGQTVSRCW